MNLETRFAIYVLSPVLFTVVAVAGLLSDSAEAYKTDRSAYAWTIALPFVAAYFFAASAGVSAGVAAVVEFGVWAGGRLTKQKKRNRDKP